MGARTWIKIYCSSWIAGSIREESPGIRAMWIDLLAMVGGGQFADTGELKITTGVGLLDEQIAHVMKVPVSVWRDAKDRLILTKRIEMRPGNCLHVINWNKYQSEYRRQKKYRMAVTKSDKQDDSPLETLDGNLQDKDVTPSDSEIEKEKREGERDSEIEIGEERSKRGGRPLPPPSTSSKAPAAISFDFKKREWLGITEEQKTFWKSAYPAVNIDGSLKRIAAWLDANPEKRKANYGAFINRWLKKDQEQGGGTQGRRVPNEPDWMKGAKKQ
jgi:hypothetical protein